MTHAFPTRRSSDLAGRSLLGPSVRVPRPARRSPQGTVVGRPGPLPVLQAAGKGTVRMAVAGRRQGGGDAGAAGDAGRGDRLADAAADLARSEEHTSELQSLMRISYAVFCLKKKKNKPVYTVLYNI